MKLNNESLNEITLLILAGGRGQRMHGKDKGLMHWQGKPMIEHIIQQINFPADKIIISANRNLSAYKKYTDHVVDDKSSNLNNDYQGPLAGILSAMQACTTPYLFCLPCDAPVLPNDLLNHLWQCLQVQKKTSALCHDGNRLQPLFSLISCQHENLLNDFLQQGRRKVHDFISLIDPAICDFSAQQNHFHNFNRPDDMSQ
ncbi:Molybdenum cofactor guanylyltransferase [hydrothermal vent metagenome]|uniref:Molybdenum cofactor guanylyltransferase n=1 Tax=hydrothermal vent metagenome TaxID=652676 RepID=A0A3B0XL87_9ZZZZ